MKSFLSAGLISRSRSAEELDEAIARTSREDTPRSCGQLIELSSCEAVPRRATMASHKNDFALSGPNVNSNWEHAAMRTM